MSRANVTLNFTYANLTTGRITATPKGSFSDVTGKVVLANIAFPSVAINVGSASIILPETELEGIAYKFVIESGSASPYTFVQTFDAIVKNISPQNGNTLLTQFFSPDSLDTSVFNIADLLSRTPYLDRLAARIPGFNFKVYTASQNFSKNDFTFRGERFYQWVRNTVGNGIDPLTAGNYTDPGNLRDGTINASAAWQVASGSLLGSGVSTTALDYDNASFVPLSTQPASRRNLTQLEGILRSSLAQPDLSGYARLDGQNSFTKSQSFGGGATVPDLQSSDNTSSVANTRTVRAIVGALGIGSLVSKISIAEERYTQGLSASLVAGVNARALNTIVRNPDNDIVSLSGSVLTVKAGSYLVLGNATANRSNGSRLYLFNNSSGSNVSVSGLSSFTGSNVATSGAQNVELSFMDVITLGANTPLTLRHIVEVGASDAGGIAANRSGFPEIFSRLLLFRLN